MNTSLTFKTTKLLMSMVAKMMKQEKSLSGESTTEPTRDGRSFILIRLERLQLKDSTKTLYSTSIDHSTLSQDSQ
jgi:hypothetical protein